MPPLQDQAPGARQGEVRPKTGHGGMCSLWNRLDLRRRGAVLFLCRTGGGQRPPGTEECSVETALHGQAPGWNLYRLRGKKPWRIEVPAVRPEIIRQIEPLPRDARLGTRIHRGGPQHRGRARALRQPGRRGRRRRVSQAPAGTFRGRRREPPAGGVGGVAVTVATAAVPGFAAGRRSIGGTYRRPVSRRGRIRHRRAAAPVPLSACRQRGGHGRHTGGPRPHPPRCPPGSGREAGRSRRGSRPGKPASGMRGSGRGGYHDPAARVATD